MVAFCICLFGETCAGKSTVGKTVSRALGGRYVSFGDLKRDAIAEDSVIGRSIVKVLARGDPIPPALGFDLIQPHIKGGLNLVSGYPISHQEYAPLSEFATIGGVVLLSVDEADLISRFKDRRECPVCHEPGVDGDTCEAHGLAKLGRPDADPEELKSRRRLYRERIDPFVDTLVSADVPLLACNTSQVSQQNLAFRIGRWINDLSPTQLKGNRWKALSRPPH